MDEYIEMPAFTKNGLQHLLDRAQLRHDFAEQEGDLEEASMCFAEILALVQLVNTYGWEVRDGKIQGEEVDDA